MAVKYFKTEGDTNTLHYSTDEGLSWHQHKFYPTPIRIFGLMTEPGENTTVFTMFGTEAKPNAHIDWIIVQYHLVLDKEGYLPGGQEQWEGDHDGAG